MGKKKKNKKRGDGVGEREESWEGRCGRRRMRRRRGRGEMGWGRENICGREERRKEESGRRRGEGNRAPRAVHFSSFLCAAARQRGESASDMGRICGGGVRRERGVVLTKQKCSFRGEKNDDGGEGGREELWMSDGRGKGGRVRVQ